VGLTEDGSITSLQDGMIRKERNQLKLSGGYERGAAKHEECEAG